MSLSPILLTNNVSPTDLNVTRLHVYNPHTLHHTGCAGYVDYTRGHLHERVEGHTRKSSSIYKHYNLEHNSEMPERFIEKFHIITKCSSKHDCLVKEMLYIRMRKSTLNVQTDSIRAKVFV